MRRFAEAVPTRRPLDEPGSLVSLAAPWSASDVTVAVLNYNGCRFLGECLESLRRLDTLPAGVLLVDDGSTDESVALVRTTFPEVRVVEMGTNTRRLNKVRNRALREAESPLVLLVDNDVTLAPECLDRLVAALSTLPRAVVCMPRALLRDDPERIYQDGQVLHYVGATHALHRGQPVEAADTVPRRSIGWGVQLIDRRIAEEFGNFNEAYVMGWGDDGEFNHRLNLAGHVCYHVPAAVVYHRRVRGARRYYGGVRNRWRFILECYAWKTLLLCAPALLVYEAAQAGFLVAKGAFRDYIRAVASMPGQLRSIWAVRKQVQARRVLPDGALITGGSVFVPQEYVDSRLLAAGYGALNAVLDRYWRLVRGVL